LGPRDSNLVGGEAEMSCSQLYWRGGLNSRSELLPIKGFLYGYPGGALASPMVDAVKREGFDPPLAAASHPTGEGVQLRGFFMWNLRIPVKGGIQVSF
jgi:hypothetical protein